MTRATSPAILRPAIAAAILALAACGCAAPTHQVAPPPMVIAPVAPPGAVIHGVARGETLWGIGRHYGVSYREIMRVNGIADPGQLEAGRQLVIPPRPQPRRVNIPLHPNPRWTHIVIHHTATDEGSASLIDRWHRRRGFQHGLGYHFVIDNGTAGRRDGQIEVGPRWMRQQKGAHCNAGGMNDHGIGICLVGNFTTHAPSAAQMASLAALVEELRTYYRIPGGRIVRHRDVPGKVTACPGDRFPWGPFRQRLSSAR